MIPTIIAIAILVLGALAAQKAIATPKPLSMTQDETRRAENVRHEEVSKNNLNTFGQTAGTLGFSR
ncbi:MAG: hypothetical protein HYV63_05290 [Candidatus Schekmanbacteria bacterium]|nr:hypothetical protein [Candidatus Schekmanbacteria bacterium]